MKKLEIILIIALVILCAKLGSDLYAGHLRNVQEAESAARQVEIETMVENTGELPDRYDGREAGKAPSVKNQGELGTCWAVAASSALESYFLPEQEIVFSADHISLQNSYAKDQNDGGDYTMVMAYLAAWQGPVLEEDDPYGDGVTTEGLSPVCHVQEMQIFRERDDEAIKWAVYQNGAVQSSIYMDLNNALGTSVYFNNINASYLYPGEEASNHDILIIGWDDHYPAENFNYDAKSDGAFICQNSWGTQFGEDGIFYVSYEDVNIGKNSITYSNIESADNYDHIYQTDLCGWAGQLGYEDDTAYFANVYEAAGEEDLSAVGFYAVGKNTEYEIFLVEDFTDDSSFADRTTLKRGTLTQMGYYTISLEEPVALSAGERYAVGLKITTPDITFPVAAEYAADDTTATVDISDGEGYISHSGTFWSRAEEDYHCNLCLKAYTKDR